MISSRPCSCSPIFFFIICLPINALNLLGFHVLECGTNTLATYPAFCTQPAGEGCPKNCNIVCNMFFSSFKISTLKSGFILSQKF